MIRSQHLLIIMRNREHVPIFHPFHDRVLRLDPSKNRLWCGTRYMCARRLCPISSEIVRQPEPFSKPVAIRWQKMGACGAAEKLSFPHSMHQSQIAALRS